MEKSVIITCATTGGIHTPTMSEYLPITPTEIAQASVEAAEAGAAIKQQSNAVLNVSTGGGLGMTREERLRGAVRASPLYPTRDGFAWVATEDSSRFPAFASPHQVSSQADGAHDHAQ